MTLLTFEQEAPYPGTINLFLDAKNPLYQIPFEFDFGETIGEIIIVAKAVAFKTVDEISACQTAPSTVI